MADETERPPASPPRAPTPPSSSSVDVASVNVLVKRTGCTIREAEITLAGRPIAEQEKIAATGKPDRELVLALDLEAGLEQLTKAGIKHDEPCPFGAPASGPVPTWGDVVARLVFAGEQVSIALLIKRAKPGAAA